MRIVKAIYSPEKDAFIMRSIIHNKNFFCYQKYDQFINDSYKLLFANEEENIFGFMSFAQEIKNSYIMPYNNLNKMLDENQWIILPVSYNHFAKVNEDGWFNIEIQFDLIYEL